MIKTIILFSVAVIMITELSCDIISKTTKPTPVTTPPPIVVTQDTFYFLGGGSDTVAILYGKFAKVNVDSFNKYYGTQDAPASKSKLKIKN
jgi:hypothetical protein